MCQNGKTERNNYTSTTLHLTSQSSRLNCLSVSWTRVNFSSSRTTVGGAAACGSPAATCLQSSAILRSATASFSSPFPTCSHTHSCLCQNLCVSSFSAAFHLLSSHRAMSTRSNFSATSSSLWNFNFSASCSSVRVFLSTDFTNTQLNPALTHTGIRRAVLSLWVDH